MKILSSIIFIVGCLSMLAVSLYVWAFLLILVAEKSIVLGWVFFIGSILSLSFYKTVIETPWKMWFSVWNWVDERIHGA